MATDDGYPKYAREVMMTTMVTNIMWLSHPLIETKNKQNMIKAAYDYDTPLTILTTGTVLPLTILTTAYERVRS